MDVNTAAVSGTVSSGGGHAHLEEVLAAMDVPVLSFKAFHKYHNILCDRQLWEKYRLRLLKRLGLQRKRGEVHSESILMIKVVADGCWSKRSYRTNYTALSGVACT
ncbi:hypothetical protein PR048_013182 [Dryococelus australis]|uniref:Mutator-like transposase domain-containing protein n=1 Tax=Dryococelus australis TaxID=614101 RepID=A0ABQ9HRF1_9NEOP|nr:hypothetical protein PR048_013182 [Dryococelus australis]